MSTAAFRSAAKNVANSVRREGKDHSFSQNKSLNWTLFAIVADANSERLHIQLRGLPRTALPSDVQRAVKRAGLRGVSEGVSSSVQNL